ncbi:MAG: thiamine-phosphate kinase [Thermoguttaceae bacterium]|nr:thiamine-phosphate kinase [Thermoguttaceae bacterium]MDW8077462.1 thiamine-phosphate kinase [Thermoguttaceae bacterium]
MEQEWIEYLRRVIPGNSNVPVGIGDDAALLELGEQHRCVVAVDIISDGVDFSLAEVNPELVGRKALAVNLSDLAAMAARPIAALVALGLPRSHARSLAEQVYKGLLKLADSYQVAIAGGDTHVWEGPLFLAVTAVGIPGPGGIWRREGARPGDFIVVTGSFGGSILGKHLTFEPRVREALYLAEHYRIHAAIDVSDGLLLDLWRLAEASGVGAEIDFDKIPIDPAARRLSLTEGDQKSALEHALSDGEDFELILAVPPEEIPRLLADKKVGTPLTAIGCFVARKGLWQRNGEDRKPITPAGYVHG